jgi:hypothetical protein
MGAEVRAFPGTSQGGKECGTGHYGYEKVGTGHFSASLVGKNGQHTDNGKDSRGKTDKLMTCAMEQNVNQVAATRRKKQGAESQPGACQLAEKMDKPAADKAVAQQMNGVSMQG